MTVWSFRACMTVLTRRASVALAEGRSVRVQHGDFPSCSRSARPSFSRFRCERIGPNGP